MLQDSDQKALAKETAKLVHSNKKRQAAQLVVDCCDMDFKVDSDLDSRTMPPLITYLHWLLNNGGNEEAAQLLWTPNQFTPEPQYCRDVWDLFERSSQGLLMGGASCTKSFSMGVRLTLEWIRDPEWTTVRVVGPSEDHLETNLFSHLVSLHQQASLPLPGSVGDLYIGLNRRNLISSIKGLVIPVGRSKKAGRIQGTKRKQRVEVHPIFGPQSRLFLFLDEIENIPEGVWSDIDNILSNMEEENSIGFKIFGAYNPTDPYAEVGKRAEPEFGWGNFDVDKHFKWKSKRGWDVLRLDGEQSENVKAGRIIFPGLQSANGLAQIAKNAGGRQSPGYMTMGRGAYPTQGTQMTIIPAGMMNRVRGEFIWLEAPKACASVDMALEGGARAVFTLGKIGIATGIKWPQSVKNPQGLTEMFKDILTGAVKPRTAAQVEQQFALPKGDTVAMKDEIVGLCRRAGVAPELLCLDRTGVGAGAHDLIKNEWSSAVIGVNYSSSPTNGKIMEEDELPCDKSFDRIDSELWFALRAWVEFTVVLLHPNMDLSKLIPQLTKRLYRMVGGKRKVESKKDYKDRDSQESPDEADSLTLFVHAARKGAGLIPSMRGNSGSISPLEDDWWEGQYFPNGVRLDPCSVQDSLEI